jgi:lipoprotein-anchoring transpeptidase ErfK/SrfK
VLASRPIRIATIATLSLAVTAGVVTRASDDVQRPTTHVQTLAPYRNVAVTTTSLLSPTKATIAMVYHRISVYSTPGHFLRYLSRRTPLGSLRSLLVTAKRSDGWLQVQMPVRPNGTRDWIKASSVILNTTPMRIVVSRRYKTLTLLKAGVRVARYPVAVGKPSTPTPTGLFYIIDKISTGQPGGAFGPYALGLSGYSNVLFSFDGGDGVVGIHGTNVSSSVGHAVTHGCIRLYNRDVTRLFPKVWLGTPVLVK